MSLIFNRLDIFFNKLSFRAGYTLYISISTFLAIALGFLINNRVILPLLCALPAYTLMIWLVKNNLLKKAVAYMLLWALLLGVLMTIATYLMPQRSEGLIIRGAEYRDEMFRWIDTGIGKEGTPAEFIPEHALHLSIFIILSVITMSSLSILFGAVLMNYMAFYVGQLLLHTDKKIVMFLVGWHFWSLYRIIGFVILGVLLSKVIADRWFKIESKLKDNLLYLWIALGLIALDIITKSLFAPSIGRYVKTLFS